jgi:PPK2 family polyphosphate:nucleotide phosphotransferase
MSYAFKVDAKQKIKLGSYDPGHHAGLEKAKGQELFEALEERLDLLQEELYAAGTHTVLAIFQGMDTAGKDGAIRSVFQSCNPQGTRVESFKIPSEEELAHDFLWRIHKVAPRRGQIGIFNRSHYEDVLVVRVHKLVPEATWRKRYEQINMFEQLLADTNTIILKFFLHISQEEQEQRLLEREQDITKAWKLSAGDWREREHWDAYQKAYEDAIGRCATKDAPWYIIPANRKWYRNLAVAEALADTLEAYRGEWKKQLEQMSAQRLEELQAFRKEQA